jgi:hypothetical protein
MEAMQMTYADTNQRAALISGLHALADYLESNPGVPTPIYSDILTFPPHNDWVVMRAEIDVIATRLGVSGQQTSGGHYVAARSFGAVEYRVVAIPPRSHCGNEQGE